MNREPIDAADARVLLEVAQQFGAALDLRVLLPVVLRRVTELLDAERALFVLYDRDGRVEDRAVHNLVWDDIDQPPPISQGLVNDVLLRREPVIVEDITQDPTFGQHQSVRLHGIRFMLGVPVVVGDDVAGVLYMDSRVRTHQDLERRRALLTALAALVATAVQNARLYEEQKFRTRLLATMVHDFRGPLTVLRSNAEALAAAPDATPSMVEIAEAVDGSVQRIERMVDNTLQLSRIDAGAAVIQTEPVNLAAAVRQHVAPLAAIARAMDTTIVVEAPAGPLVVETVPERLWIILDNLLLNALKHARGAPVRVGLGPRLDGGPREAHTRRPDDAAYLFRRLEPLRPAPDATFAEVWVENGGPPIAASLLPRVFMAFVHGEEVRHGYASTGLGLAIVNQCVRHLGGTVWVRSNATAGTRFTFTLPTRIARAWAAAAAV